MNTEDGLSEYLIGLYRGETNREWFDIHEEFLIDASPLSVNLAIDKLIAQTDDFERIDEAVARFIRAASRGLERHPPVQPPEGHFLGVLLRENRRLEQLREELKEQFKKPPYGEGGFSPALKSALERLWDLDSHYRKIQYGLFPAIEIALKAHGCLKLMWKMQDDVMGLIGQLLSSLDNPIDSRSFNQIFGKMFLKSGSLIYREERILFPVALEAVPAGRFESMKTEIDEYGTAFGVRNEEKGDAIVSENIRNREERKDQLKDILGSLRENGDIQSMKKRFKAILQDLSPEELAEAEQALISEGVPVEEVQRLCEVHVAAFEEALQKSSRKERSEKVLTGHPVDSYRKENRELKKLLGRFRRSLSSPETARTVLDSINEVEKHYARKENQLFPFLEGVGFTGPSKVMWGKHDEIRGQLKEMSVLLSAGNVKNCRRKGRELIISMKRMIFMEEKILFPTALRKLPESTWKQIRRGEKEIGYAWMKPGSLWDPDIIPDTPLSSDAKGALPTEEGLELSVGRLLPLQIDLLLKNLPLDVTYVDENDRVRYYSQGKERIFPRSPGIIGRDVQNCHPPKSVHVVRQIVEDFRNRKRTEAEFWIQMGDQFIHIRYFPLFEGEVYRGVLEVSQDLTRLRALTGEKRLLDGES